MKVLDLRCSNGHAFEGWFGSEADFGQQHGRGLVECPMCADKAVSRLPSAPRLNLSGARPPRSETRRDAGSESSGAPAAPSSGSQSVTTTADNPAVAGLQALWMHAVREVIKNTEDVGNRFPEEARRIHYGEIEARGIRGQATAEERAELSEEGIDVMPLPMPEALKGPTH